jgi:hypothetical protein
MGPVPLFKYSDPVRDQFMEFMRGIRGLERDIRQRILQTELFPRCTNVLETADNLINHLNNVYKIIH